MNGQSLGEPPEKAAGNPERGRDLLTKAEHFYSGWILAVILALGFQLLYFAYATSLPGPFIFDDVEAIAANPDLRTDFNPSVFFRDHETSLHFDRRPVPGFVTWLDFKIHGFRAPGYRITNLFLHLFTACSAFWLIVKLAPRFGCPWPRLLGLVTVLLWAIHPIATNTVSFIFQRNELLMSLFYVLALLALAKAQGTRSVLWLTLSCCAAVLSVLSKETGLTFIVVAPLLERLAWFRSFRELLRQRGWFYGILAVGYGVLTLWILTGVRMSELAETGMYWDHPWGYFKFQCSALLKYLYLMVWPHRLNFFSLPLGWDAPAKWVPSLGVLLALGAAVIIHGRREKWLWACAVLLLGLLAPTTSILPIPLEPYAEFRMYLPSLAVLVTLVVLLGRAIARASRGARGAMQAMVLIGVLLVIAAILTGLTRSRNRLYASSTLLWENVVRQEPRNGKAWGNLGIVHLHEGRFEKAEACGRTLQAMGTALKDEAAVRAGSRLLALVALEQGRPQEALNTLREIAQRAPEERSAQVDFALALVRSGHQEEAEVTVRKHLVQYAHDPFVRMLMAEVAIEGGRYDDAKALLNSLESELPGEPRVGKLLSMLQKTEGGETMLR